MDELKEKKILVVDDQPQLLRMVDEILRREGFTRVFLAPDCARAMEQLRAVKPDLAVLDVMLPDGDGFSLMQQMRAISPLPVVFLTARGEDEDRLIGLGMGADDYIVKPFLPKELTLRITAILRRVYVPIRQEQLPAFSLGDRTVDLGASLVRAQDGREWTLTAKEHALLKKLYENRNRIVTSDALCQAAWGDDLYGYENTLRVHIRRMREKLEQDPSHPQYLLTARGLGYKLQLAPTKNA